MMTMSLLQYSKTYIYIYIKLYTQIGKWTNYLRSRKNVIMHISLKNDTLCIHTAHKLLCNMFIDSTSSGAVLINI